MYKKILSIMLGVLLAFIAVLGLFYYFSDTMAVLNPQGIIGLKERDVLVKATLLMLLVVIPVFVMALHIAWKYRATNVDAEYKPEWDYNFLAEAIWWGLPLLIVLILSHLAWYSTHELDPFRPIESDKKPLTIQVIALQYKWLFIYPEEQIATLNYLQIPVGRPIRFEITAESPMNSFWIPQLGGQIYAMPGMKSLLHLEADNPGVYRGSSANLSGTGFASMYFYTKATPAVDYEAWVKKIQSSTEKKLLNKKVYEELVKPSQSVPPAFFLLDDKNLFEGVVNK